MEPHVIYRAALGQGQIASVGDLYDMRTNTFCGISIIKKSELPKGVIKILDADSSDIEIITRDTYSEKFLKMGIDAELSVSLLVAKTTLEGSGKFLYDKTNTSRTAQCSLFYKGCIKDEQLNISHEDLITAVSTVALQDESATHVLTGISWGASVVISCTYESKDNKLLLDAQGKLSAKMEWLKASISAKGQASVQDGDIERDMKFKMRIIGDVLPAHGELPLTFEGALDFIKQLPKLSSKCNDGKGKPLVYRFLPISKLRSYLNLDIKRDNILISLEDSALAKIVNLFDKLSEAKQGLNDFQQEVTDHRSWFKEQEYEMISEYILDTSIAETTMKSNLSQILTNVRSGKDKISEIYDFIKKFDLSDTAPHNIQKTIDNWKPIKKRLKFAKELVSKGAIYIELNQTLDDLLPMDEPEAVSLVFYFRRQLLCRRNYNLLLNKMGKKTAQTPETTYYALDCELHDITLPADISSYVKVYKGDECIVEDLLKERPPPESEHNERADDDAASQPTHPALPSALSALLNSPSKDHQHHAVFYTSSRRPISECGQTYGDTDYVNLPTGVLDKEAVLKVYNDSSRKPNSLILEHPDISKRVKDTLPTIVDYAIQLPNLLKERIPYLNQGRPRTIYVTRRLACSLLAHCFLCTVPHEGRHEDMPAFHFLNQYLIKDDYNEPFRTHVKLEKLKYILEYFNQMGKIGLEEGNRVISFERRSIPERMDWKASKIELCNFSCNTSSGIETAKDMLQVEFIEKHVGIGMLGNDLFMDDMRFLISPELILSRLFTEPLLDDEVLIVTGTKQYFTIDSEFGLGPTLCFEAGVDTNPVEIDSFGRESCQVVFMDDLSFLNSDRELFKKCNIDRELHKFFVGFSLPVGYPTPVATGDGGNNYSELNTLLQWMAAAMAGRPSMVFHAGSVEECHGIMKLGLILKTRALSVGKLYKVLLQLEGNYESLLPFKTDSANPYYGPVFQFVCNKI